MDHLARTKIRNALSRHVHEFLGKGLTLQFMGGMTPDRMFAAFEHARALFNQEDYNNAMDILKFLCVQNHLNKSYFLYLGACYQKTYRYHLAVKAYTHASVLDPGDPRPHFNVAMCYLAENDLAGAEYAVADAQSCTKSVVWSGDLQVRLEALKRAITTRKNQAA